MVCFVSEHPTHEMFACGSGNTKKAPALCIFEKALHSLHDKRAHELRPSTLVSAAVSYGCKTPDVCFIEGMVGVLAPVPFVLLQPKREEQRGLRVKERHTARIGCHNEEL